MSTEYRPKPGSLAEQVVSYFRLHPNESMSIDDIIETFRPTGTRGNVQIGLQKAIDAGLLLWRGGVVSAGAQLDADVAADPGRLGRAPFAAIEPPGKKNGLARGERRGHLPPMDIDALKVETGVPLPTRYVKRDSRWTGLLDKLAKPGQSIQIPREYNGSLNGWLRRVKKTQPDDKRAFRVGLDMDGINRIWRVE